MDTSSIPNTKRCSKCDRTLPRTNEYFYNHRSTKDRLSHWCKECTRASQLEAARKRGVQPKTPAVVDGKRRCFVCDTWKPADTEHFVYANSRQFGICIECNRTKAREYYHANAECRRQYAKQYTERRREDLRLYYANYRREHLEERRQNDREYGRQHREEARQRLSSWRARNSEKVLLLHQRRRTNKRRLPTTLTVRQWNNALNYFNGCCAYCGKQRDFWNVLHADHFVPLSSPNCEGTTPTNIIPACKSCNLSKHAQQPEVWLERRFGKRKAREILKRIETYFEWVRQQG